MFNSMSIRPSLTTATPHAALQSASDHTEQTHANALRSASPEQSPSNIQESSRNRLALGNMIKLPAALLAGVGVIAGTAVGTVGLISAYLPAKTIAMVRDKFSLALKTEKSNAANLKSALGSKIDESGIIDKRVSTIISGTPQETTVGTLMESYRSQLQSKVTNEEMHSYINMGQRIMKAIHDSPDGKNITINEKGITFNLKSDLETTRAISWYLQAKAINDNASTGANIREPAFLNRGSMLMKDPKIKIYNFLNSSSNVYGRASTHFNERRASDIANFKNTGAAGMLAGLTGNQAAQRGIEDFDNKMPSGKGCLLFDKLSSVSGDGTPALFMKWESMGTPTVFGSGTHADQASGWSGKVDARFGSMHRCLGHTLNFITSRFDSGNKNWGVRRESANKGETKKVMSSFKNLLDNISTRIGKDENWKKDQLKGAKTFGITSMENTLKEITALIEKQPHATGSLRDQSEIDQQYNLKPVMDLLMETKSRLGNDLGIERRGDEIHVEPYMNS